MADFSIDMADPNIRLRNIGITVEPSGWFTKLIWRFIKHKSIECTWFEERWGDIYKPEIEFKEKIWQK